MIDPIEIVTVRHRGAGSENAGFRLILTGGLGAGQRLDGEPMEIASLDDALALKHLRARNPSRVEIQWGGAPDKVQIPEGDLVAWLPKMRAAAVRAFMGSTTALHQALPRTVVRISASNAVDWTMAVACIAAGIRTDLAVDPSVEAPPVRRALLERAVRVRPKCLRDIEATLAVAPASAEAELSTGSEDFTQDDLDRLSGRRPMKTVRDMAKAPARKRIR